MKTKYFHFLIFHIIFIILFTIISDYYIDSKIQSSIELQEFYSNIYLQSFAIIIIAPIIEELLFRFPLKNSYLNIINCIIFLYILFQRNEIGFKILIVLYVFFILLQLILKKNLIICSILSILIFGLIHLDNYVILDKNLFNNFLLIFPQLLLGTILSIIRFKEKFITCILYHSSYNSIILCLAMIFDKIE